MCVCWGGGGSDGHFIYLVYGQACGVVGSVFASQMREARFDSRPGTTL